MITENINSFDDEFEPVKELDKYGVWVKSDLQILERETSTSFDDDSQIKTADRKVTLVNTENNLQDTTISLQLLTDILEEMATLKEEITSLKKTINEKKPEQLEKIVLSGDELDNVLNPPISQADLKNNEVTKEQTSKTELIDDLLIENGSVRDIPIDMDSEEEDEESLTNIISFGNTKTSSERIKSQRSFGGINFLEKNKKTETLSPFKQELKTVLARMDQVLKPLPEDKIEEFTESKHFDTYRKLFIELELAGIENTKQEL